MVYRASLGHKVRDLAFLYTINEVVMSLNYACSRFHLELCLCTFFNRHTMHKRTPAGEPQVQQHQRRVRLLDQPAVWPHSLFEVRKAHRARQGALHKLREEESHWTENFSQMHGIA